MIRNAFLFFMFALIALSSLSAPIHTFARQGNWPKVNELIAQGIDPNEADQATGESIFDIATARGELHLINVPQNLGIDLGIQQRGFVGGFGSQPVAVYPVAPPPIYSAAVDQYVKPEPVQMLDAPSAPPLQRNMQAARLQEDLADQMLAELEQFLPQVAAFDTDIQRAHFIASHRAHLQNIAINLQGHLRAAFLLAGRGAELEGNALLEIQPQLQTDRTRVVHEQTEAGFCKRSKCNTVLAGSCWGNKVVKAMHNDCSDGCWLPYTFFGLYAIPVAVTWVALSLAQAVTLAVTSPCLCEWVPSVTAQVAQIDVTTETKLKTFIGQMKVFREALKRGRE